MSEVNPTEKVAVTVPESKTPPSRTDPGPVIGGLHLRSTPGACLLFAGVLLIAGIAVAVMGYWNSQPRRQQTPHHVSTGRTSSEKLKLIGPVIMGVGLFIFICANTVLFENRDQEKRYEQDRDKEDQEILPQVQTHRNNNSKGFSQIEMNTNMRTLEFSEVNIHCLEEGLGIPTLKCSSPSSCSSSQVNLETGSPLRDHRNMGTLALPVIKLNDCLIGRSDPEPQPLPEWNNIGEENITNVEITHVNPADSSLITLSKEGLKDRPSLSSLSTSSQTKDVRAEKYFQI